LKYNAFISYSHAADGKMAPALQSALERFSKPWYKIRNLNIFRDESSLSATPHLWANIQAALDESEYLIYLASPESAESHWVQKEIEYWLEQKSIDTLLIGLTAGEINLQHSDSNQKNSLPKVLIDALNQEPFYIDLRITDTQEDLTLKNSIFKKEVLKVAAQLHGKAPKDMASAEVLEHRKMVWLRNSAIVVLIALLGFSVFQTIEAKKQTQLAIDNECEALENEAEAKRQEQIAIQERDKARKAKDETVPWVILSTWSSAKEYSPPFGYVTGIRGLMEHAKSLVSLEKIRYLSPVNIFTKGPHDDEYDWTSQEFGHYNPEFLEWASTYLIPGADDEMFRRRTQKVYDKHLKVLAESYCRSYENLQLSKELIETQKQAYLDHIAAEKTDNFFNGGVFSKYSNEMEVYQPGLFPHYVHVAAGFWIRREIDGTAEHFIKAIRKLIKTYDPELYEACNNIKHPFDNAIAEFIPGTWHINNDQQNNAFARFATNGELWIQVGNQTYQHSWESVGKDHFKIDGKDVKKNYRDVLIGLPELGEKASITKLYSYRPKAWDDYAGVQIEPINTTTITSESGEFKYSGNGYWYGHNMSGDMVEYSELGRNSSGIYLYHEESHTYIKFYLFRNQVFVTTPNQPVLQWTQITGKYIEEVYEGPD